MGTSTLSIGLRHLSHPLKPRTHSRTAVELDGTDSVMIQEPWCLLSFDNGNWLQCESQAASQAGVPLTDVLVGELVCQAYALWLMLDRLAVDYCLSELLYDGLVDRVALCALLASLPPLPKIKTYKVLHCASRRPEHDGSGIVGHFALGLRVDADEVQLVPHLLQQFVDIPAMF
jgi:hypothetical protein